MAFAYHMPPTIQDKKLFNRGPVECGRIRTICEVEILFEFFTVGRKEAFRLRGGIAQLVERLVRNEKVRGSNPLTSTNFGRGKAWRCRRSPVS